MKRNDILLHRLTWHEVSDKVSIKEMQETLNAMISMNKYGKSVRCVHFTFIAVPPSSLHENEAHYDKANGQVEMKLNLSYSNVKQATQERVQEMMAALFLVSTDLYDKWALPDFDVKAFRKDIGMAFEKQGWLRPIHEY